MAGGTVLLHHPFAPSEKGALCPLAKHVSHFATLQLSGIELWSPPHRQWPPWILTPSESCPQADGRENREHQVGGTGWKKPGGG